MKSEVFILDIYLFFVGGFSLFWSLIWFTLVRNSPDEDYLISAHEKRYLKQYHVNISGEEVSDLFNENNFSQSNIGTNYVVSYSNK